MKAAAVFTALAAAALLAMWAWQATPAPDRRRVESDAAAKAVAREGPAFPPRATNLPLAAPDRNGIDSSTELSLTDNQELIPDFALHQLMDGFLLNRSEVGRLQALEAHLRRTLPATAAGEAIQIASRYQNYLIAHDELLAAQRFTSNDAASQDLNRISSWRQQRRQLRIRTLGERITLEWFGNEDAYLEQALNEWRQRSEGQAPATADVAPEDQAAHEQHMQQALSQAITGYQRAAKAN
ncbi:hypothetical protein RugamoR64_26950 [Duganella rhizosphaerae]|uniref:hypothetical protein n=1 Tax=Duganella rhizosphaerae TaxID=2885763 RepID=UPI0030E9AC44